MHAKRLRLRWVTDTGIGTTLRLQIQRQIKRAGTAALHGQTEYRFLVVHLGAPEGVIVLFLARRQLQWPQTLRRVGGMDTELVAVQVIALGNLVAHFHRLPIERPQSGFEGNQRVEEFLGSDARAKAQ